MAKSSSSKRAQATAGLAFLLSQVGAHSSSRFGERLEPVGLKPAYAGILRVINEADGLTQQALGEALGVFPSRLVALIDELEARGLVERRSRPADRRSYALYLTKRGQEVLRLIEQIGLEHQEALCACLTESERATLTKLLARIAAEQGLSPGVHPGFRKLGDTECK
jgi:DNA-binding MarR family transcriptional regulator